LPTYDSLKSGYFETTIHKTYYKIDENKLIENKNIIYSCKLNDTVNECKYNNSISNIKFNKMFESFEYFMGTIFEVILYFLFVSKVTDVVIQEDIGYIKTYYPDLGLNWDEKNYFEIANNFDFYWQNFYIYFFSLNIFFICCFYCSLCCCCCCFRIFNKCLKKKKKIEIENVGLIKNLSGDEKIKIESKINNEKKYQKVLNVGVEEKETLLNKENKIAIYGNDDYVAFPDKVYVDDIN
jgi:hypothetical protein